MANSIFTSFSGMPSLGGNNTFTGTNTFNNGIIANTVSVGTTNVREAVTISGSLWLNSTFKFAFQGGTNYFARLTDSNNATQYDLGFATVNSSNNFLIRNWLATTGAAGIQLETGANGVNKLLFNGAGNININGIAGFNGTVTPVTSITVTNGIVTAVS